MELNQIVMAQSVNCWETLYEILIKRFKKKAVWSTDAMKLAQMIELDEQYPSVIVRKAESAVGKINKQKCLNITLDVNRPRNGKAVLTFSKTQN